MIPLHRVCRRYFYVFALIAFSLPCFCGRAAAEVIITEIHYNPSGADEQKEFIELKNAGNVAADMSGWQFTNGVSFTFPNGTVLAPGEFFVVVANPGRFALHYPGVAIGGQFTDEDDPWLSAIEWFEYNILGAYMGKGTPIYIERLG